MPQAWRPTSRRSRRRGRGKSLVTRLRENERVLLDAYRSIAKAVGEGRAITPGRGMAARQLSSRRSSRSARSAPTCRPATTASCRSSRDGPFAGYPRVFGLAWAFVAHTDSRFDPETLRALRARLSDGAAADDRRAVGGRDHAAHRAGRESAAARRADRRQPRSRARGGRRVADQLLGVNGSARRRRRRLATRSSARRCPTRFAVQLVQRLRDQDPRRDAGARLARRAPGGAGHERRRAWCATSISGRARRTSRCATSSPACG